MSPSTKEAKGSLWIDGFFKEISSIEQNFNLKYEISVKNTWFIIDWDDTLLPTTRLARLGVNLETPMVSSELEEELEAVDSAVATLLRKISNFYGKILIVTNAQPGWIELSSKKFLPETHDLIFAPSNSSCYSFSSSSSGLDSDDNSLLNLPKFSADYTDSSTSRAKVTQNGRKRAKIGGPLPGEVDVGKIDKPIAIYSAREMFEKYFENPSLWKVHAFKLLLERRIPEEFKSAPAIKNSISENSTLIKQPLDRIPSSISLNSIDLSSLVEEKGSFEVEMAFDENDSFFSVDFSSIANDFDEFDEKDNSIIRKEEEQTTTPVSACNLISIGDCKHDCDSLQKIDLELKNTLKKTVKFKEFPTVSQLTRQLHELGNNLHLLVKSNRDLQLVAQC